MNPRIIQYNEVKKEDWDIFVRESSMGYGHLLYDVVAIDRWDFFSNLSFAVFDGDKDEICMVSQLHLESCDDGRPVRLHSRWGFAYKDGLPKKEFNKLRACYIEYIDYLILKHNAVSLENSFPALTEYNQPPYVNVNPGIYFGYQPNMRYSNIIDLKRNDLLKGCENTTRAAIRKIENANVYEVIKAKPREEDYSVYNDILRMTYIRTCADNYLIPEYYNRNIFFKLIPQGISQVFFLRRLADKKIVAAVCIMLYKNSAYYWWGGSVDDREVGINKYLLFKVIERIKAEYAPQYESYWFETGAIYPYVRNGKQKGISDFKKCFGGFLHPILSGHYVMPNK